MVNSEPQEITAENYRQEALRLLGSLRSLEQGGRWLGQRALLSEGIGTLYWQFGDAEAKEWFDRALELSRNALDDPTVKRALLYWKLADGPAFREECRSVVGFHALRLKEAEAGRLDLPEFQRVRGHREPTFGLYLLGEYELARVHADQALEFGWEKQTPGSMAAVNYLVDALTKSDEMAFVRAMEILRSTSPRWPTDGSSVDQDFYRYNLALGSEKFPDVTRFLEPFGNGRGRGVL